MSNMRLTLIGNVGKDPVLSKTTNGKSVLFFSVADNVKGKDKDNNTVDVKTNWYCVAIFGKRADSLHKKIYKGARVTLFNAQGDFREDKTQNGDTFRGFQVVNPERIEIAEKKVDMHEQVPW